MIETLFTALEFFKGRNGPIQVFFEEALLSGAASIQETIISAVVHMDEKRPICTFIFIPLTEDGRLSAKDIMGNKKKLTWWQDEFWKHMVRGFQIWSAVMPARPGATISTPRVQEMTRLTKQKDKLEDLLAGINPFNAKSRAEKFAKFWMPIFPAWRRWTLLRKYGVALSSIRK